MSNVVKKVAAIHDMSGLGRCSLTAAIPILSVLGVQPCPFPTALLSCQTGYDNFSFLNLTEEMKVYKKSWKENNFKFDGIYSGFLGSEHQIETVIEFIEEQESLFVLVDPVMGDNGEVYKTYSHKMCDKMKELVKRADVVTPNLTEGCILTDRNYHEITFDKKTLYNIAEDICNLGPDKVVITGIVIENKVHNFAFDNVTKESCIASLEYNGNSYSGTGDVFASVLCGMLIKNKDFFESLKKATNFIGKAIEITKDSNEDYKNGVQFEPVLKELFLNE